MLTRRNLLRSAGGILVTAPFVCSAANLMKVVVPKPIDDDVFSLDHINRLRVELRKMEVPKYGDSYLVNILPSQDQINRERSRLIKMLGGSQWSKTDIAFFNEKQSKPLKFNQLRNAFN